MNKTQYIEIITSWGGAIVSGFIVTGICQIFIQNVSGNLLEKIPNYSNNKRKTILGAFICCNYNRVKIMALLKWRLNNYNFIPPS